MSYGDPQTVQVNARRDLGAITLNYRVNGGKVQKKSTSEWGGGLRYGDEGDYWYHRMRGQVTGTDPGDSVEVWFTSKKGNRKSSSFTYEVASDSNADVLVLAVEDYSGNSDLPPYANRTAPNYLQYYTAALGDTPHAVYSYDADYDGDGDPDRKAPDPLGVLSHFDAVIWYTGNDNVTRKDATPGVADLEAHRTITAVRDFVNEGGRVALQGVNAGRQYDLVEYPQEGFGADQCDGDLLTTDDGKCQPLSNDFAQYYLGSYVRADGGGLDENGDALPVTGLTAPLDGWSATLDSDTDSANNHHAFAGVETGTHLVTSSILDPDVYPQFASEQAADWATTGDKPFDPHSGAWYMTSQNINEGYKRMRRTIDLSTLADGQPAELSFFTSYNTEQDWDFVFVEARTQNADGTFNNDWTTLPEKDGLTHDDVGASCPSGWTEELHNHLRHYQTFNPAGAGSCTPSGSTGTWNAASGNSGGWQEWNIDLSQYHGQRVELSIVFATDWGTLTVPGMLVDDTKITVNGVTTHETDFETDQGGWEIPGAHPEGPSSNLNDWIRSQRIFEDAAVTKTAFGLMFGFGLEGVDTDGEPRRADAANRELPPGGLGPVRRAAEHSRPRP